MLKPRRNYEGLKHIGARRLPSVSHQVKGIEMSKEQQQANAAALTVILNGVSDIKAEAAFAAEATRFDDAAEFVAGARYGFYGAENLGDIVKTASDDFTAGVNFGDDCAVLGTAMAIALADYEREDDYSYPADFGKAGK